MSEQGFEPRIVGFLCRWCAYPGADLAGSSRLKYPANMTPIRVMCSGRVDPAFVLKALAEGADGVLIAGCHPPSDCHYQSGNIKAMRRYPLLLKMLKQFGIEQERVRLEWISASEGVKFAQVVREMTEAIRRLGPLNWGREPDGREPTEAGRRT
ncbi:MAG: hydrogenase iron-sulfur subunit [Chloroflexi bacterium]|nr:hydrogenase iron-sulfur subunit [Chloroflexota bacterium]